MNKILTSQLRFIQKQKSFFFCQPKKLFKIVGLWAEQKAQQKNLGHNPVSRLSKN
jgi:hypothetical protein